VRVGTIALMGVGGLFLWSGFHGAAVTGSLRDLVSGSPAPSTNTEPLGSTSGSTAATAPSGDTSAHSSSAAANQAIARLLAAPYGWSTGQQWTDLVSLWNQESGWSTTALNPTTKATGIPQLNPADYPIPAGWSSASVQITWGLQYIKGRYGSPSAAWQHETQIGWY
jgi:resuscitation-promoting factor RpfB